MKKIMWIVALFLAVAATANAASLTVNDACKLNGTTWGLEVNKATVGDAYVRSDHPTDETHMLIRFCIDPDTINIPQVDGSNYFQFLRGGHETVGTTLIAFLKRGVATGNYRLTVYARRADGPATYKFIGEGALQVFNAAPAQVEIEWTRGNPGTVTAKVNNVQIMTNTVINPTAEIDTIRWGVFAGDPPAISGDATFCLDEYESYR